MAHARIFVGAGCILLALVMLAFALPHALWGDTVTLQVIVTGTSTPVLPPNPSAGGGGGGGGGGPTGPSGPYPSDVGQVIFQGIAYPGHDVTLTRDGTFLGSAPAGADAKFQFTANNVTPGSYTYGVWSSDSRGVRSVAHTFTVAVTPGVGTVISGIYLPPTIDIDKTEVRRGEVLTVLGQTAPLAQVSLVFHSSQLLLKNVVSRADGVFAYPLDTLELAYGDHDASARSGVTSLISEFSQLVAFKIGDTTVYKNAPDKKQVGELNNDGKVNLIDLSIMSFWYKRPLTNAGKKADLNNDGVVNLQDFSILAYYWTG